MDTIALGSGVGVTAELEFRESFVVTLTGLLKRTLKWHKPPGTVIRYGVQWTRGQRHDPERPMTYVGTVLKTNVRNLPGFPKGTARFSFAVTAIGKNGRRIGEPGILENVRVM